MSFHSQSQLDDMSVTELVSAIQSSAREVDQRMDDAWDALAYVDDILSLTNELRNRIEGYLEDEEDEVSLYNKEFAKELQNTFAKVS